jgi:hypothetical protein
MLSPARFGIWTMYTYHYNYNYLKFDVFTGSYQVLHGGHLHALSRRWVGNFCSIIIAWNTKIYVHT